jgi:hypothetical protein
MSTLKFNWKNALVRKQKNLIDKEKIRKIE